MTYHRPLVLALILITALSSLPAAAGDYPDNWYWDRVQEHTKFEGMAAPKLTVGEWVGEDPKLDDALGQIVVIDFWATWCQPCLNAMPKNTALAKKYAGQGVVFVGVCTSGDKDQMAALAEARGADYPNAYMAGDQIVRDWPIQWYPTYAVIDGQGVVRAIGLKQEHLGDVIEELLDEQAAESGKARIRSDWFEGTTEKRARLADLESKATTPPKLVVKQWINTDAIELEDLEGKVVLLDFWATWSPNCLKAVPLHNKLAEKYADQGLVIIGICSSFESHTVQQVVEKYGIAYPVCVDVDNKTNTAYSPDGYPDYYLIDRAGNLRIADCTNESIEKAVKALLAESKEAAQEATAAPEAQGDSDLTAPEAEELDGEKPGEESGEGALEDAVEEGELRIDE